MSNIITKITKGKTPCLFISPHLDDAILSCGGLISYLSSKTSVKVITVFSKASSGPYTMFAKRFIKNCSYDDADTLFADRRVEDKKIMKKLKSEFLHLGFVDAAFRKKDAIYFLKRAIGGFLSELLHLYPLGRNVFSGKIAREDERLIEKIESKLWAIINQSDDWLVFCPLAIGQHVDHCIVRHLCQESFGRLIYWSDFPYNLEYKPGKTFIKKNNLASFSWDRNLSRKKKLILGYKSHVKPLFPDGKIPIVKEQYFFSEEVLKNL